MIWDSQLLAAFADCTELLHLWLHLWEAVDRHYSSSKKEQVKMHAILLEHFNLDMRAAHSEDGLVQFSVDLLLFRHSLVSDSLWPRGLRHTTLPCPSSSPGVCWNSCPLSPWCNLNISSNVALFSSCPQSFPSSGSFPVGQLFASGGQWFVVSATASVLPMNTQDWAPLGWTGWISLQSKDSQESPPSPQFKSINSSVPSLLCGPTVTSIHDHWKKQ